jgi:hypothetical protein
MIYNTGHKFTKFLEPISQEDIFNTPEYFAMSREEVLSNKNTPDFLKNTILEFPWSERPSVLQIRPQNFQKKKPPLLGDHWHIDVNVRLKDGITRVASSISDWRLLVCSWGDVVQTEFMATPMDLPDLVETGQDHGQFFDHVSKLPHTVVQAAPNQLAEYTSKDIHRMGTNYTLGRFRLMIVAFESSDVRGEGWTLPSIRQQHTLNAPRFEDYIL